MLSSSPDSRELDCDSLGCGCSATFGVGVGDVDVVDGGVEDGGVEDGGVGEEEAVVGTDGLSVVRLGLCAGF